MFPGPDREASYAVTFDAFPAYVRSPVTQYYLPSTSPVTPPFSVGLLPRSGVSSAGGPASLDSLLAYDITLLDSDADLSLVPVPLLQLPAGLQLLLDTALDHQASVPVPGSPVVFLCKTCPGRGI